MKLNLEKGVDLDLEICVFVSSVKRVLFKP